MQAVPNTYGAAFWAAAVEAGPFDTASKPFCRRGCVDRSWDSPRGDPLLCCQGIKRKPSPNRNICGSDAFSAETANRRPRRQRCYPASWPGPAERWRESVARSGWAARRPCAGFRSVQTAGPPTAPIGTGLCVVPRRGPARQVMSGPRGLDRHARGQRLPGRPRVAAAGAKRRQARRARRYWIVLRQPCRTDAANGGWPLRRPVPGRLRHGARPGVYGRGSDWGVRVSGRRSSRPGAMVRHVADCHSRGGTRGRQGRWKSAWPSSATATKT